MTDLRRTLAVLRQSNEGPRVVLRLADLDRALLPARQSGIEVATAVEVAQPLPDSIEAAAYRIVQESITNIVRHSGATRARVEVRAENQTLHVSVVDDGRPREADPSTAVGNGHGIAGMRERAESLGGTFTAGRTAGGFHVRATLPLEAPS
jgi:signal transduction histidine kinase